jgi:hypothetical protein
VLDLSQAARLSDLGRQGPSNPPDAQGPRPAFIGGIVNTTKVRMVQLLCPERHCVMGFAYESEDGKADRQMSVCVTTRFDLMVKTGYVNPWCGLCKSKDLHTEDGATVFATMEEARPRLLEMEREQAAAREFWKASKG